MGTEKRERQKANREAKLAAQAAEEAKRKRKRFIRNVVILVAAIIVTGFLLSALSGCSSDDTEGASTDGGELHHRGAHRERRRPHLRDRGVPARRGHRRPRDRLRRRARPLHRPGQGVRGRGGDLRGHRHRRARHRQDAAHHQQLRHPGPLRGTTTATSLFRTEATSGIIQGGSPHTQDAADPGPGYTIPDEALPFTSADYAPGVLAMARTSEPDSASAQFFFLANEGGSYLGDAQLGDAAGTYVVFGRTTAGLDVLEKIANLDDGSGVPSKPVSITRVTITER